MCSTDGRGSGKPPGEFLVSRGDVVDARFGLGRESPEHAVAFIKERLLSYTPWMPAEAFPFFARLAA